MKTKTNNITSTEYDHEQKEMTGKPKHNKKSTFEAAAPLWGTSSILGRQVLPT